MSLSDDDDDDDDVQWKNCIHCIELSAVSVCQTATVWQVLKRT